MKKLIIILTTLFLLLSYNHGNAESKDFKRFNNLSIYQHSENNIYKLSLFTSLEKDTWFCRIYLIIFILQTIKLKIIMY